MKKILTLVGLLIILIGLLIVFSVVTHFDLSEALHNKPHTDPRDATYLVDGVPVVYTNGVMTAYPAADSMDVGYFGNDAKADLNADGKPDTAFLIAANTGGTGTFFYLVVALSSSTAPGGIAGSEAYFIGDRIAPQTTNIDENGVITVNYADRAPGEPFTAQPSVGKSLRVKLDPSDMKFGIVATDFEGEANPSSMRLDQQSWHWISTKYNDGANIVPRASDRFVLTFKKDGTFSASTDCNGAGGDYSSTGSSLSFKSMMSTLMFCEGSQEQDFTKSLAQAKSYHFTSRGELILDLAMDSGIMIFK